ncbi:DUF4143 domain-containing protein [Candidatus Poriferisodalis sp.]|uniref:DUF4143 domain-containing protein n=1 Tax=Candidatus Poriferisodalis sp. TaxID=3101277 RepID=UPI003B02A70B
MRSPFGFVFESLVVRDLRTDAQANDAVAAHYRDGDRLEADAAAETSDGRWIAVEGVAPSPQLRSPPDLVGAQLGLSRRIGSI